MVCVNPQIKPWNAVDEVDVEYVTLLINTMAKGTSPTSGFLAGQLHGGPLVQRLEEQWAAKFGAKYAISFNSGTSALLAASHAAGFVAGKNVVVPALSMSATAAMPAFLGANLIWADVDAETYCARPKLFPNDARVDGVVVTNLFGNTDRLHLWREFCDDRHILLVEDNCQGAFAKWRGKYAGTWGDIGVFSLNVHKHMQCGEGGVAVTNDGDLAQRMRMFRNHGEVTGYDLGLNLRMTELTAAMALAQLSKGERSVQRCRDLAKALIDITEQGTFNLNSAYYVLPMLFPTRPQECISELQAEGVPISAGYAGGPLYWLPAFRPYSLVPKPQCTIAEYAHVHLGIIEICAIDPTPEQIAQIGQAFEKVAGRLQAGTIGTPQYPQVAEK